jgi:hypothetical protein
MTPMGDTSIKSRWEADYHAEFGEAFDHSVCVMPEPLLLRVGIILDPDAPSVRHFDDPAQRRYYRNEAELKRTIRALWKDADAGRRTAVMALLRAERRQGRKGP